MAEATRFLVAHGYLVLFLFVLLDQAGLPLPSPPLLLAAGALAGTGDLSFGVALAVVIVAALPGDLAWYQIGRRRGARVLQLLCRISLEPDSCVRNTERLFARHGARSLLVAKLLPGYSTMAPALAGIFHMRSLRFAAWDAAGALFWAGAWMALGLAFHEPLDAGWDRASRFGGAVGFVLAGALVAWLGWRYVQRQRFLRTLRIARITPEELKARLEAGEPIELVDVRHSLDFEVEPESIPGARHLAVEEFDARWLEIPREREIILFCT